MGWSIGFDIRWNRDIGYGVPAYCDHPECNEEIHRGLSYVCGGEPYGGEHGCGLFFCAEHLAYTEFDDESVKACCDQCIDGKATYPPKPDHSKWIKWKLTDESWQQWRDENPELVSFLAGGGQ